MDDSDDLWEPDDNGDDLRVPTDLASQIITLDAEKAAQSLIRSIGPDGLVTAVTTRAAEEHVARLIRIADHHEGDNETLADAGTFMVLLLALLARAASKAPPAEQD